MHIELVRIYVKIKLVVKGQTHLTKSGYKTIYEYIDNQNEVNKMYSLQQSSQLKSYGSIGVIYHGSFPEFIRFEKLN